jgi:hypothetical protein
MSFSLSLRQAAVALLLANTVVAAQLGGGLNRQIERRSRFEGRRSVQDYVDSIVKRQEDDSGSGDPFTAAATTDAAADSGMDLRTEQLY